MRIILATHNPHKRDELAAVLGTTVEVELLPDNFPDIEETGSTLSENAFIKANTVFDAVHKPSLADDTGLEVEALSGAPGVFTARYAGENASYDDNCQKLLAELSGSTNRNAVFKTILCFISENGDVSSFEGIVSGRISTERKGDNGFGYDPVFIPTDGDGRTFAEMTTGEKNKMSHRSRAVRLFTEWLRNGK
jgi:XTP/dITP diphosphohydrolase